MLGSGKTGEENEVKSMLISFFGTKGFFTKNSSCQAKQSIPHTTVTFYGPHLTVMLYGDCENM
jgi:hypothetical protein